MTQVIHVHDAPKGWETNPEYVYIGRQIPYRKPTLKRSKWANPFKMAEDTASERNRVVNAFERWLAQTPDLLAQLPELEGKILVCWCKKDGADVACHGDVLAGMLAERGG